MEQKLTMHQLHGDSSENSGLAGTEPATREAARGAGGGNKSLILMTGTRYLLPLLIMFALFLLLRGHNEPGGGFVGGLVTAAALALYAMAVGEREARRLIRIDAIYIIALGLVVALGSGLLAVLTQQQFLTGMWHSASIPLLGKLGTPFMFDVGVYLVVTGIVVKILFTLLQLDAEEAEAAR